MNAKIKLFLFLSLIIGMTSCVSNKKYEELQAEKEALAEQLDDLNDRVENLEIERDDLKGENDKLAKELNTIESRLNDAQASVDRLESELTKNKQDIMSIREAANEAFGAAEKAAMENDARLEVIENRLKLDLAGEGINFPSGSARLDASDRKALENVANLLKASPDLMLLVEGHTDTKKLVEGAAYRDNWDLSLARSMSMVRMLIDMGVNPEQLIAAGASEYHPVATNDTAEGRQENRRGVFIVIPKIGKLYKKTVEMRENP